MKRTLLLFSLIGTVGLCSATTEELISPEIAGKNAIYAMMSTNVYHDDKKIKFPLDKLGWELDSSSQNDQRNGLAYDVMKKQNEAVFVIRGTDGLSDWKKANFKFGKYSRPYTNADTAVTNYKKNHPNIKITGFTGHSLGGAIALYLSAKHGIPAYAFDASPRIFEAEHLNALKAQRILIFQNGEIMELARKSVTDWQKLVDASYRNNSDFAGCDKGNAICLHSSDELALALLRAGKGKNPELEKICDATPGCKQ